MIELNIRWLYILIGLTSFLLGFLLLIIRNSSRQVPGPLEWAIGCFFKGSGLVYFSFYPWPDEFFNLLTSNLLLLVSNSFFVAGIWKFKGKALNSFILIGIPALSVIGNVIFILFWNIPIVRIVLNSSFLAFYSFLIAYEFIIPFKKVYRNIFAVNAISFLVFGLTMVLRALSASHVLGNGIMVTSGTNVMIFAFSAVIQGISTYCFIIMVNIWVSEDLKMQVALRDKFLSIIAHDLKNQINIIGGFSELLHNSSKNHNPEKVVQFSGYIRQAAIQTSALLNNLLEWARLKTKSEMYLPEEIGLSAIIKEEIDSNSSIVRNKDISIEFLDGFPDITVVGDKNMVRTILRNLIINAVKFTNKGGRVKLAVSKQENFAEVSVSDSGIGIKPEDIGKLFDSNHLHSTEGTDQELGSGLGLLLCKEFVEKHGGQIWVESEFEKGSTFKFTLPIPKE